MHLVCIHNFLQVTVASLVFYSHHTPIQLPPWPLSFFSTDMPAATPFPFSNPRRSPPQIDNSYWGNPTKIAIAGYASIVFFGLCAFFLIRKLPDTKPGLIIDSTGLTDNSSGLSAGHILWTDIENIYVIEIHKQKLLMLEVKNPHDYIDREKSLFKRKGMELNYKMYGTPLSLTSNGLKISFQELLALVTQKFQETRTNAQHRFAAIPADE